MVIIHVTRVCSLFVCLFARALKGKCLDLSTLKLVEMWPTAGPRQALTLESKGQGGMGLLLVYTNVVYIFFSSDYGSLFEFNKFFVKSWHGCQ